MKTIQTFARPTQWPRPEPPARGLRVQLARPLGAPDACRRVSGPLRRLRGCRDPTGGRNPATDPPPKVSIRRERELGRRVPTNLSEGRKQNILLYIRNGLGFEPGSAGCQASSH